jgi:hypothetical protein
MNRGVCMCIYVSICVVLCWHWYSLFWIYFRLSDDIYLVGGDIHVDYEGACGDFINLKILCRLNISKVLIMVGCAFVRS